MPFTLTNMEPRAGRRFWWVLGSSIWDRPCSGPDPLPSCSDLLRVQTGAEGGSRWGPRSKKGKDKETSDRFCLNASSRSVRSSEPQNCLGGNARVVGQTHGPWGEWGTQAQEGHRQKDQVCSLDPDIEDRSDRIRGKPEASAPGWGCFSTSSMLGVAERDAHNKNDGHDRRLQSFAGHGSYTWWREGLYWRFC